MKQTTHRMQPIHFISFANTKGNFSTDRIKYEAQQMRLFSSVKIYTENDFDEDYKSRYGHHFRDARGYGYWSWKPYVIRESLRRMNDGEYLVYADTGCSVLKDNKVGLIRWCSLIDKKECKVLSPCFGPYMERQWTKMDTYDYINKTYNKDNKDIFHGTEQIGSGVLMFRKSPKTMEFVEAWFDVMNNHYELATDKPSVLRNDPSFQEHRHDQSVFSLLGKCFDICLIRSEKGIFDKWKSPIIISRIKTKEWNKPFKILYDNQTFDAQKFGGISNMFTNLYREFNRSEIVDSYTGVGLNMKPYPKTCAEIGCSFTENVHLKGVIKYPHIINADNASFSKGLITRGDYDVFHPTFYDSDCLNYLPNDKALVISVHDLIPEIYKGVFFSCDDPQIIHREKMLRRADAIEVPSMTTKKDLLKFYPFVDERKIFIIGRGISNDFGKRFVEIPNGLNNYILFVGERGGYKNFSNFVRKVIKVLGKYPATSVVCTGKGFTDKETEVLSAIGIKNRFIHIHPTSDEMMASLYKNALCFCYPSWYEGFGIPILEACKCGCPIILNDTEVFREIGEKICAQFIQFDSDDDTVLLKSVDKIVGMTDDEKLCNQCVIDEKLKEFSWENVSSKLLKVYEYAVREHKRKISQENSECLDIFISAHTDFSCPVQNPCYKIICGENSDLHDERYPLEIIREGHDSPLASKDFSYAECSRMWWIRNKYPMKDYVGFCQYRKFFKFYDNIPKVSEVFMEHDVICLGKYGLPVGNSVFEQYRLSHNSEDMMIVMMIVERLFPEYATDMLRVLGSDTLIPFNMFIMKKEDFMEYCDFIFKIMKVFDLTKHFEKYDDIYNYVKECSVYHKGATDDAVIEKVCKYQSRIQGYLIERLTNVFIAHRFKNPMYVEFDLISEKIE